MDFHSFLTSLGTFFVIFLILMLLFTCLSRRPGNYTVYYPNRILKGLDPLVNRSIPCWNPFAWIREALSSTEEDVIRMSGVDSAVYFVFLSTALGITVLSALVLLPLLLPVAATVKSVDISTLIRNASSEVNNSDDFDRLSMRNVKEESGRLWAFVIGVYWVSFVAYYLLWKAYKHASRLRAEALKSPEVKAEQFALLVRDIPKSTIGLTRKEQVDTYFKTMYADTFYRSMVVTNNKEVNKLWDELQGYKKKLAHAEAVYVLSKKTGSAPEGTRPTHKKGKTKVDSIEFYKEKINELIPKLEAEQKVTLRDKQQRSAIVFFNSRGTAASASLSIHAPMVDTWTVTDAPEPRQLIWPNLPKNFYERRVRQIVVYFVVALTVLFSMIPIGFISAFTTLERLQKLLGFLKPIVKITAIRIMLEAYLPQITLMIFLAMLKKFLLFLSKAEGIPSESHAIRATSGKYFYFTMLNVFIGFTLGGTLLRACKNIKEHPKAIVRLLAIGIPPNATFFLTYVSFEFFVGYGLELSRIIPLIKFHIKKKYVCKTEAELKEAWAPTDLKYVTRAPNDMLIFTIVLCYSVIAPIILPFGVLYFALGWLVLRNQVLKVFVPAFESYGRMWPHLHTRILAALLLFQVTMFGYFGIKEFPFTPLLVPLPILSFIFAFVCRQKFYRFFHSTALEVAYGELKEIPNMEDIFKSFIPPSLISEKPDDEQVEDALSEVSKTGSFAV